MRLELATLFSGSPISVDLVDDFLAPAWRNLCTNAVAGIMAVVGGRAELYKYAGVRHIALQLALEVRRPLRIFVL